MSPIIVRVLTPGVPPEVPASVQQALASAMDQLSVPPRAEMTLVLADDQLLRRLNRTYSHVDEPTDVLAFPADDENRPEGEPPYLGDVIVSIPRAEKQARYSGHGLSDELRLLAVHGLLHLLGHDHDTPEGSETMERLEVDLGVRRPSLASSG